MEPEMKTYVTIIGIKMKKRLYILIQTIVISILFIAGVYMMINEIKILGYHAGLITIVLGIFEIGETMYVLKRKVTYE